MTQRNAYNQLSNYKTTVAMQGDYLTCTYVATPIVRYRTGAQPSLVLDSGGYQTVTTKKKMNQFSHQYANGVYGVFQENFEWFVIFNGKKYDFFDGMDLYELDQGDSGRSIR